MTKSIEVHFSRSHMFLLYFFAKKSLAEVPLTHAEEKWRCRTSSFHENEILNNSIKTFQNQWGPMGFCKQKKCEKISTTRLKHVDFLHSFSIYPQESENKTEKRRKPKVKTIATIARQSLLAYPIF